MSINDWEAIKPEYEAGSRSLRDIASEFGVSEGAIRKQAKARGWVRKEGTQKAKSTQKSTQKSDKVRTGSKVRTTANAKKSESNNLDLAKPAKPKGKPRGKTNFPPFQKGNTFANTHNAYARRMLLSDDVVEEANALTLQDELFRLRAGNLMATDSITRLNMEVEELEQEEPSEERDKKIARMRATITGAHNGIAKNTSRIESIEHTLASIAKMAIDCEYRVQSTEKVVAEVEAIRNAGGNTINATIVHHSLPIPR